MSKTAFFSALAAGAVDAEAGIISGVSVITVGEAKGHEMFVDGTTIEQVKACAEQFPDGLQVKVDHFSGFNGIVGVLKNFAIDGDQLRADLHLLQNHDARARIIEMAQTMPSSFGLSISFSGEPEMRDVASEAGEIKARFARCLEIYSADLVDAPAANPDGLFSEQAALVTTLRDQLATALALAAQVEPLRQQLAAKDQELTVLRAEHGKLAELHKGLKASFGLNAAPVIPAIVSGPAKSLLEQYQEMPAGPARLEFFQKHKDELRKQIAASGN